MATPPAIIDAYLRRLGLDREPPSLTALTRLHRRHVERVPYETFWIHLHQPWGIDPVESMGRSPPPRAADTATS